MHVTPDADPLRTGLIPLRLSPARPSPARPTPTPTPALTTAPALPPAAGWAGTAYRS